MLNSTLLISFYITRGIIFPGTKYMQKVYTIYLLSAAHIYKVRSCSKTMQWKLPHICNVTAGFKTDVFTLKCYLHWRQLSRLLLNFSFEVHFTCIFNVPIIDIRYLWKANEGQSFIDVSCDLENPLPVLTKIIFYIFYKYLLRLPALILCLLDISTGLWVNIPCREHWNLYCFRFVFK